MYLLFTVTLAAVSGSFLLAASDPTYTDSLLRLLISGGVLLFALAESFSIAMVGARKWHAEYINVSTLLQAMILRGLVAPEADLVATDRREPFAAHIHTSRGFLLVQVCLLVIGGITANFVTETTVGGLGYGIVSLVTVTVVIWNNIHARLVLRRADSEFWENPSSSWC